MHELTGKSGINNLCQQVEATIRRHSLFRRGQPVLVAVSGGVDSMVLLDLLARLAPKYGWRLTVAHLNHRLRGRSSGADEQLVRRAATELKLAVIIQRADIRKYAQSKKVSIEMAARELRHAFLARTAVRRKTPSIALAHHGDDQVELFFLRLLRGSGGEGLSGMDWQNASPANPDINLVRPLLNLPKSALKEYATKMRIPFREDASNQQLDIQRNRIRHELLPLLRRHYQPGLDKAILRVMEIVGAEADDARQSAEEWIRHMKKERRGSHERQSSTRASSSFDQLSLAVQRRCLQLQLQDLGIATDFELVEQLRISPGTPVSVMDRAPSPKAESSRAKELLRDNSGIVRFKQVDNFKFSNSTAASSLSGKSGKILFEGVQILWKIRRSSQATPPRGKTGFEVYDPDKVGQTVQVRHWQPGDRFQPIGMDSALKLQDFFTNEKVPRARRHELLLATTAQGEIFWVENMRISERFKLSKGSSRILEWRWKRL